MQVLEFLKSQELFLDRVLYHLGTSAIMDLLLRLVTSMEPTECRSSCVQVINSNLRLMFAVSALTVLVG